jgi:hypothetical protein
MQGFAPRIPAWLALQQTARHTTAAPFVAFPAIDNTAGMVIAGHPAVSSFLPVYSLTPFATARCILLPYNWMCAVRLSCAAARFN